MRLQVLEFPRESSSDFDSLLAFTQLPSVLEQREVVAELIRVLLDFLDVQVDPQSRLVADVDIAVHDLVVVARQQLLLQSTLNSSKISWMKWLGVHEAICMQMAVQIGPCALCGATTP